jgi:perosamine synthetase
MKKQIKLFDPVIDKDEINSVVKTIKTKFWASGAGGPNVNLFEKKFNKYIGSNTCVTVNSGTAALHLALSLYDVKNKEVILPSLSFVSTAHAVVYNGGKPIFADINPHTLCIDPKEIERNITKKTKAIIAVHLGGLSSNIFEIKKICKKHNLTLIEDAAHATGSSFRGKKIGTHGDAVCFSFHPVKNLAMPTGGAITLNNKNKKFDSLLRSKRWCGISNRDGQTYDVTNLGWNYYMNEISAAIGIEQLRKLDRLNNYRKKIAKKYYEQIKLDDKMPFQKECAYHLYWIRVKNREKFMKNMTEEKIETGIHYIPIHRMKLYRNKTKLPVTELVGDEIVTIPIHPNLTNLDVDRIIKSVNRFS